MAPVVPSLDRETAAWAADQLLIGIDEAGRGPLAGPVVAAAVVFPAGIEPIRGVRDSKTLPAARRQALAAAIRAAALAVGVGAASRAEIDRVNIRVATALAMRRAVVRALRAAGPAAARLLVDGRPMPELGHPHDALVDGDALCYSIAAAGIVAKTVRDHLMERLGRRYPAYGWAHNMGYGTRAHLEAIRAHGTSPHHRVSFRGVET